MTCLTPEHSFCCCLNIHFCCCPAPEHSFCCCPAGQLGSPGGSVCTDALSVGSFKLHCASVETASGIGMEVPFGAGHCSMILEARSIAGPTGTASLCSSSNRRSPQRSSQRSSSMAATTTSLYLSPSTSSLHSNMQLSFSAACHPARAATNANQVCRVTAVCVGVDTAQRSRHCQRDLFLVSVAMKLPTWCCQPVHGCPAAPRKGLRALVFYISAECQLFAKWLKVWVHG